MTQTSPDDGDLVLQNAQIQLDPHTVGITADGHVVLRGAGALSVVAIAQRATEALGALPQAGDEDETNYLACGKGSNAFQCG